MGKKKKFVAFKENLFSFKDKNNPASANTVLSHLSTLELEYLYRINQMLKKNQILTKTEMETGPKTYWNMNSQVPNTRLDTGRAKEITELSIEDLQIDFPFFLFNEKPHLALHDLPIGILAKFCDISLTAEFLHEEWYYITCKIIKDDPDLLRRAGCDLLDMLDAGAISMAMLEARSGLSEENSFEIRDAIWHWDKFKVDYQTDASYFEALWARYKLTTNDLNGTIKETDSPTKWNNNVKLGQSSLIKSKLILPKLHNKWKVLAKQRSYNAWSCDTWQPLYIERRKRNFRRNKRKIHLFCSNNISINDYKYIDIDPSPICKLKEHIANIRHWNRDWNYGPTSTTISNGSLSVQIHDTFWIEIKTKIWSSRNVPVGYTYYEKLNSEAISEFKILTLSLQFIHNKLLDGFYPDKDLEQQVLSYIKMMKGTLSSIVIIYATALDRALVSWINTWSLSPWSLQTVELQILKINLQHNWERWFYPSASGYSRSPLRHSLRETLTDLKSICFKLYSLLHYLEDIHYNLLLNHWNNCDANLILTQTFFPNTAEIIAAQLVLESALNHIQYSLSHVNRILGERELKQSMAAATMQYTQLQEKLDSVGLLVLYLSICKNLNLCHKKLLFSNMDVTVDLLTHQHNYIRSSWLFNLWTRTKAVIMYSNNFHTDLLIRRFEAKEYLTSLSAISFAESLTTISQNQVQLRFALDVPPTTQYYNTSLTTTRKVLSPPRSLPLGTPTTLPPQSSDHKSRTTTSTQPTPITAIPINNSLLPSALLSPYRKSQIKQPMSYILCDTHHGTSPVAPLLNTNVLATPLPPLPPTSPTNNKTNPNTLLKATPPLQPYVHSPQTPICKALIKLPISITYYSKNGPSVDPLPLGKTSYALPLPQYCNPDNRTGIG